MFIYKSVTRNRSLICSSFGLKQCEYQTNRQANVDKEKTEVIPMYQPVIQATQKYLLLRCSYPPPCFWLHPQNFMKPLDFNSGETLILPVALLNYFIYRYRKRGIKDKKGHLYPLNIFLLIKISPTPEKQSKHCASFHSPVS